MMDLSQYRLETLHQDGEFILYRGLLPAKQETSPPSILALSPVMEHPAPATVKKMEHEFSLKDELDPAWAIRPIALTQQQSRTMLLFEDPNAEPLDRVLRQPLELKQFLRCAIALAAALGQVHRRGLIHKDIKPSNVLANAALDRTWLMGFSIASRLPRERQRAEPPEFISGTLAYMAPEQTGRMNRSTDSRSDLYALGITLYELLTGSLPFAAADPMEWVHCHVARRPPAPAERRRDVPSPVSAIIMKLLAKTPEERYQTAAGVESDLRCCLEDWDGERGIHAFPLGEHDIPDRLLIPEKLYGREPEVETLLTSFDHVLKSGRPELVLVSGYSGIGKSSVVNELHKPLVPPRGLFASGKFDQYKRDIPYATVAQAFQSLLRPLLTKSEADLAPWREALREALGPNGRLIIDLVPELKLIIGEQPPVPELPPQDAQRRFQLVFRRFIGVFARPEHPLALFLDDLQWLDAATLDLLEDLLTRSELRHLMLIGAYRDNEIDAAHPLMRKLDVIRTAGGKVKEITLGPLAPEHLGQLFADALRCETERGAPLAQLVHEKTGGNPFFTIQFISSLADEGLLTFDHAAARWSWDLDRIHAKGYTDNVVDLMTGKLTRLPALTQTALQQLACLGNLADSTTLALVLGSSEEQVHAAFWEGVRQELVEQVDGSYKFIHDRVQEAAYALIPEESRAEAHLTIGRLLLAQTPPEKRDKAIFEIVNQLNRGAPLITSHEEREQLAELNLTAGKRAKAASAFASALKYLTAGAALLPEDAWERRQDLPFELELHRADCDVCLGALEAAEERLAALATRVVGAVQRCAVAHRRVDLYVILGAGEKAMAVALECLRHVGIDWSAHPTEADARSEYERIWSLLGNRTIEDLVVLPLMQDAVARATLDVLTSLVLPALYTDKNLYALSVCKATNLSLEHGYSDAALVNYVAMGMIAGPRFGHYDRGYRFGKMACDLLERRGLTHFGARTYVGFAIVVPWTRPLREGIDPSRRAFQMAKDQGDPTYASLASRGLSNILLALGHPLDQFEREAGDALEFVQRFGFFLDRLSAPLALARMLRGRTTKFGSLDDGGFTEHSFEERITGQPSRAFLECYYWIRKLQARFFAGDYTSAIDAADKVETWYATSPALSLFPVEKAECHFYAALSRAARCGPPGADPYAQHREALAQHTQQLRALAANCPQNFEDRAALVDAEIARIEGRPLDAMDLYERAIASARANGFVHNEALAYERAAAFYRERGFHQFADAYLRNARACYASWGADGKVSQLDGLYPGLKQEQPLQGPASTITAPVEGLDLATVIHVSQAVSSEIVTEKLFDTVMRKAMEQAGAERGLLILPHGDELQIEAESKTSGNEVLVRMRDASGVAAAMPESIVRYVMRTHESVILDDASSQNPFSGDPYFLQHHVRSILCLPLLNQAKLSGVLYLENNLAPDVFTSDRITVLSVLASQAAISLENTRLFRDLEDREAKIRRLVDANVVGIVMWNLEGAITGANDAFLRMVRYDREDLASGRVRWTDLTPPEWRNQDEQTVVELKAKGVFQPCEKEYFRKDGSRLPILIGGAFFEDSGNEGVAFILDLSEQKRAEAEIRALKDELYKENLALRDEVERTSMFDEIVGTSNPLKVVLSRIAKVAPTDSTVLITGETGTGKELVARAIHRKSERAERAFVSVNCAAIPRDLIPSELFGHEKGAFTGAVQQRLGRFELASGGTIFLDEVGELPAETQIALLRVLQEREFERVGGTRRIRADVRVIAATNRDLQAAIRVGSFRSDLFYRLNVFPIEVPPLRERREDIRLLVEYFIDRYARNLGKKLTSINKQTLELVQSYPWPGNVRELQNVIERSVILCETNTFSIDESWLAQQPFPTEVKDHVEFPQKLLAHEKDMIEAALKESRGRVYGPQGAAAKLGIPRSTLESKIKTLRIDKHRFKVPNNP